MPTDQGDRLSGFITMLLAGVLAGSMPAAALAQSATSPAALAAANTAFTAQQWKSAAEAYERIAASDPKSGQAWLRLGISLQNLNESSRAKDALERALALQFNLPVVHGWLARVSARLGDRRAALTHLEKAATNGYGATRASLEADPSLAPLFADSGFSAAADRIEHNRFPCRATPEHRALDFWVGSWDVYLGSTQVGQNEITRVAESCALLENWNSPVQKGHSISFYDASAKQWRQIFVFDNGTTSDWFGQARGDGVVFTRVSGGPSGAKTLSRMTFAPVSADSVTQVVETSGDEGKSWLTTWNSVYVRRK